MGSRQNSMAKIRAGPTQKGVEREKMEKNLQEVCREVRDRLNYTNQDIADETGIPPLQRQELFRRHVQGAQRHQRRADL